MLGASGVLGSAFWKPDGHNIPLLVGMGISALGTWYFDTWWKPSYAGAPEIFGGWTWVICGLLVGVGTKVCLFSFVCSFLICHLWLFVGFFYVVRCVTCSILERHC